MKNRGIRGACLVLAAVILCLSFSGCKLMEKKRIGDFMKQYEGYTGYAGFEFLCDYTASSGAVCVSSPNCAGAVFSLGEDTYLETLSANLMGAGENKGLCKVSVYAWTGDYETTVKAKPLCTAEEDVVADVGRVTFHFPLGRIGEGTYLYLMEEASPIGLCVPTANVPGDEKTGYVNGKAGYACPRR